MTSAADAIDTTAEPDDPRAYLNSLSRNKERLGDTTALHPDFASRLAGAIRDARAMGLNVGLESGYRGDKDAQSAYDRSGESLHSFGAAADVNGIGPYGSPTAQLWANIAEAHGLYNPYKNENAKPGTFEDHQRRTEYNHWQLIPDKLENRPDLTDAINKTGGDATKIWNVISPIKNVNQNSLFGLKGADMPTVPDAPTTTVPANLPPEGIANLLKAYQTKAMPDDARAAFERDVAAGKIMLPQGIKLGGEATKPVDGAFTVPQNLVDNYNAAAADPYNINKMPEEVRRQIDRDLKSGTIKLPSGAVLNQTYPSLVGSIRESLTGEQRQTAATKNLPDFSTMPELGSLANKVGFLTSGGADEIVNIIKKNNPDVQSVQDEKGNWILKSGINGREYVVQPGATVPDLIKYAAITTAFTPAAKAATVLGAAAGGALTQAGLETAKTAVGGTFDPTSVALAGATNLAVPLIAKTVSAVASPARRAVGALVGKGAAGEAAPAAGEAAQAPAAAMAGAPPIAPTGGTGPATVDATLAEGATAPRAAPVEAPPVVPPRPAVEAPPAEAPAATAAPALRAAEAPPPRAPPEAASAPAPPPPANAAEAPLAPRAPDLPPVERQTAPELVETMKKAAAGDKAAQTELARQAQPNPERMAAGERLGVTPYLTPDVLTDNPVFRDVRAGLASVPGSLAKAESQESAPALAKRANDLIEQLGGTHDLTTLNDTIRTKLEELHDAIHDKTDKLYKQINEAIPAKTPAPADNVVSLIKARADVLGGESNLSSMEKRILSKLQPKQTQAPMPEAPTGRITPQQYKDYQAAVNKAQGGTVAKQPTYALLDDVRRDLGNAYRNRGPFKDSDTHLVDGLYGALTKDQEAVANAHGMGDLWKQAKTGVVAYKEVQNNLSALFGKQLDRSMTTRMGTAMSALTRGNDKYLLNFLKAVPANMRQNVVASGLASAFGKHAASGEMNFGNFKRWYEALQTNKGSFNAVMTHLPPQARQQLQDLYELSQGVVFAARENISTGRIREVTDLFRAADHTMDAIYGAAKHIGRGIAVDMIGGHGVGIATAIMSAMSTGAKAPAIEAADKFVASQVFKDGLSDLVSGKVTPQKVARHIAYSRDFIKFARAVNDRNITNNKEKWLLNVINGYESNNSNNGAQ